MTGAVAKRHRMPYRLVMRNKPGSDPRPAPGLGQPHSPSRKVGTIMLEHP